MIKTSSWFSRPLAGALLMVTVALGGCKLGESTESLPNTRAPGTTTYGGPPPATADVQSFKLSVWDNLVQPARCGDCHNSSGQSPRFVHEGDVNIAYAQANTVVNLGDPAESAMVAKVAGGHHCWLASDQACADTITNYIANWAGGSSGTVKTIDLRPPVLRDPGVSGKQCRVRQHRPPAAGHLLQRLPRRGWHPALPGQLQRRPGLRCGEEPDQPGQPLGVASG
ncbi:hypothetical protein [uncultured Marinobacter sp.]|uniref:hypothetical protein n=1 Tax=uncultured Marinobacter sp. TaxID=187379 RepID=UPI0030D7AF70